MDHGHLTDPFSLAKGWTACDATTERQNTERNSRYDRPSRTSERLAMAPLEQHFRLEVEFHRRLRTEAREAIDSGSLHTSYAMQNGYEQLIRGVGAVTTRDIVGLAARQAFAGDTRDVLRARDSVMGLFGVRPVEA